MVSSMSGRGAGGRIRWLLVCLASVLAVGGSQAQGGYLYQTRHTQHSPNAARQRHAAVKLGDGRVGVFGGLGRTDVEIFQPTTEQFAASRATRGLGDFAGAALPGGNALLVNGQQDCVFDYLTEQYIDTQKPYIGSPVRFAALVPLSDGKIFICGGWDASSSPIGTCGFFDPRALQFYALGDLAVPRVYHSAVLVDDHQALIAGGYGYSGNPSEQVALDSVELYDTNTGRSARIRTPLQKARYAHGGVRLPDGRVLLLGGTYSSKEPWLRSTEIFDPKSSILSDGPALGLGRSGAPTAVLPSGRIAIFGGNYDARTVEIYCPDTGTFVLADSLMLDPRSSQFTATSLNSGAVLLVGGKVNDGAEVIQKAEIFEEVATEAPSAPPMTLASVRQLLTDGDPNVVNEATAWLVGLGPQAKPILQTLSEDESSELRRLASSILQSIDLRNYPTAWCVEVWDAVGRLDTVWLDSFECPDSYNAASPPKQFTAVLGATQGVSFTHLVVRFPAHAPYEVRVKLFNLVGWTRISRVLLGNDLSEDDLARAVGR